MSKNGKKFHRPIALRRFKPLSKPGKGTQLKWHRLRIRPVGQLAGKLH